MREFRRAIEEAHDMATAGGVGTVIDEVLRHAEELLDIVDDAIPPTIIRCARLNTALVMMRQELDALTDPTQGNHLTVNAPDRRTSPGDPALVLHTLCST